MRERCVIFYNPIKHDLFAQIAVNVAYRNHMFYCYYSALKLIGKQSYLNDDSITVYVHEYEEDIIESAIKMARMGNVKVEDLLIEVKEIA